MELVQKLIKKTSKYLFYSPLTEKVLTECPCSFGIYLVCLSHISILSRNLHIRSDKGGLAGAE